MSIGPIVANGQPSFSFPNPGVWGIKELKDQFFGVAVHPSETLIGAQGQNKFASNTEIIKENENTNHNSFKRETIDSRNVNTSNYVCYEKSGIDCKSQAMKPKNKTTINSNGSLSAALLTKPVNMQNGKALHKRRKSTCSIKKGKTSPGTKNIFSPGASSVSVSKLHFRFSGSNGGSVTLPSSPIKMHESGQLNMSKSVSPISQTSVVGREYLKTMPIINNNGNQTMGPLRKSFNQSADVYMKRVKKIFLSEKQSGSIKVDGTDVPCAPPATPTSEQLLQCEYIPCLNDIRSQRAVRQRLQVMEKKEQRRTDRLREEQAKVEKQLLRQKEIELKKQQRQEIYALNEVMTALENKRFEEFCKMKGIVL